MSRTKKDRPMWVRNNDVTESNRQAIHYCYRFGKTCDIDTPAPPHWHEDYTAHMCHYHAGSRIWWEGKPHREDFSLEWHRPERALVRVGMIEATKLFNGRDENFDEEYVFVHTHRKGISWFW